MYICDNMANKKLKYFLLTGDPGVGKTTLAKKLAILISKKGVKVSGFYTEEIRMNRVRQGFDIVTLDGLRGRLARDQSLLNEPVKFKVGKYGVLIKEFEKIALPCLRVPEDTQLNLLVIDEIGKMEFFSDLFKSRIREIFDQSLNCIVLATIPVRKSDPLTESIRNNSQAKVWLVTKENRNNIHENILQELKTAFNFS